MFNPHWNPDELTAFEERWSHCFMPRDGHISLSDAESLMVQFQGMADELGDHVANALYLEENAKYNRDIERVRAFRASEAKSDRGREADASVEPIVQLAEKAYIKAKAIRKLVEARHESAIRSHHACKALLKQAEQDKWLS